MRAKARAKYRSREPQYASPRYTDLLARLAANVRRIRSERGWSQEATAARCGDMSTYLFQLVESGTTNPTATTLARLCDGFDLDVVALLAPVAAPLAARTGRRPRRANSPATKRATKPTKEPGEPDET
jgi:transcriptional regulator with XRE-family HTH domain